MEFYGIVLVWTAKSSSHSSFCLNLESQCLYSNTNLIPISRYRFHVHSRSARSGTAGKHSVYENVAQKFPQFSCPMGCYEKAEEGMKTVSFSPVPLYLIFLQIDFDSFSDFDFSIYFRYFSVSAPVFRICPNFHSLLHFSFLITF